MTYPSKYALEKAAQVWCKSNTSNKVMDVELATAFAEVIDEILKEKIINKPSNTNPFYNKVDNWRV